MQKNMKQHSIHTETTSPNSNIQRHCNTHSQSWVQDGCLCTKFKDIGWQGKMSKCHGRPLPRLNRRTIPFAPFL